MPRQMSAVVFLASVSFLVAATGAGAQSLGVFSTSSDVGTPSTIGPGTAEYDGASKTYTICLHLEQLAASVEVQGIGRVRKPVRRFDPVRLRHHIRDSAIVPQQ